MKKPLLPLLISPQRQALLIRALVKGELPFSERSRATLQELMFVRETTKGSLYGKTGSGYSVDDIEGNNIGWFVGYRSGKGRSYAFACLLQGEDETGVKAKQLVEKILEDAGLL